MAVPRDGPYIWVTWITKLMAGEANCEWAAWFKAHHKYEKLPSDFDTAAWTADHTAMVRERVSLLKSDGFEVFVEDQNHFSLRGMQGAVLAGKPDLVAVRGDQVTVIDCKTGSPKNSDHMQALVYMIVLPHTHHACKGRTLTGEIQYRNNSVIIPAEKITPKLREQFRWTMHQVGGDPALPRVPSYGECRFCDISARDCPDRVESPPAETATDHDLF